MIVPLLMVAFCGAFAIAAVLTPLLVRLFGRVGFVDEPSEERWVGRDVSPPRVIE